MYINLFWLTYLDLTTCAIFFISQIDIKAYPSAAPSRPVDVSLTTGGRDDLQIGGHVTTSYGYIFNMRTKADAGVVILTGFDFYTESTDDINFESIFGL